MISVRADLKVFFATKPIDFRKGVHGLVALVSEALKANPYCGSVFVFRSKRLDRLKLITWDGTGMVLVTKWLEESGFVFPPIADGVVHLTAADLSILLAGLDWTKLSVKAMVRPAKTALSGLYRWRFSELCFNVRSCRFALKTCLPILLI